MKNQTQQIENERTQAPVMIYCCEKRLADFACQNKRCLNLPFLCSNGNCQCRKNHPKCALTDIKSILRTTQPIRIDLKSIQQLIQNIVEKSINYLSQFRDKLILSLRFDFGQVGPSKYFYQALQSGNVQKITSKHIWQILNQVDNQIQDSIISKIKKLQQQIKSGWECVNQEIIYTCKKIYGHYQNLKESTNSYQLKQTEIDTSNVLCQKKILQNNNQDEKKIHPLLQWIIKLDKVSNQNQFKTPRGRRNRAKKYQQQLALELDRQNNAIRQQMNIHQNFIQNRQNNHRINILNTLLNQPTN